MSLSWASRMEKVGWTGSVVYLCRPLDHECVKISKSFSIFLDFWVEDLVAMY